jgi:hypothetical protein
MSHKSIIVLIFSMLSLFWKHECRLKRYLCCLCVCIFVNHSALSKSNSKLYNDRRSVSQSVLVSGTRQGPATNFSHSLFDFFFYSFGFVDVGRPLWREVGSVLFSFCGASPAQPFSDLSPTRLISIVYCVYFWDSPNLEGQVHVFIYFPQEQGSPIIPAGIGLLRIRMPAAVLIWDLCFMEIIFINSTA